MRALHFAFLLPLAACSGGQSTNESAARTGEVSLTNASRAEVAAQAAAAAKAAPRFEPGEWQTVITVDAANIPGMPPAATERMKALAKTSVTSCMTPEQAERPDEAMFGGKKGSCRFDRYVMKDGKLDATMRCAREDGPGNGPVITMKGSYAATGFDLVNSMTAAPVVGHPEITMTSHVVGKRLGACKK